MNTNIGDINLSEKISYLKGNTRREEQLVVDLNRWIEIPIHSGESITIR